MGCPACDRIKGIRRDPAFLAELEESYAVLADAQGYPGWCTLLLKDHAEHLDALPVGCQRALFEDVARVAAAVLKAFSPRRLNYECLGNVTPHVHWHIIPRYVDDPDPGATVWVRPAAEREAPATPAQRDERVRKLREALEINQPPGSPGRLPDPGS